MPFWNAFAFSPFSPFSPKICHRWQSSNEVMIHNVIHNMEKKSFARFENKYSIRNKNASLKSVKVPVSNSGSIVSGICSTPGLDIVIENDVNNNVRSIDSTSTQTDLSTPLYNWSFIDSVYLITCPNADPNAERLTKTKQTLSRIGISEDVLKIREFETDDEDRIRGCYTSHISVLKEAETTLRQKYSKYSSNKNNDWFQTMFQTLFNDKLSTENINPSDTESPESALTPKVLVFEDNLELTGNINQSILNTIANFSNQNPWDMIHLSYTAYVPNLSVKRTTTSNIVLINSGIGSALGTTAYLVSLPGIQSILKEHERLGYYAPIPDVMAKLFPDTRYAAFPVPFLRAPKTKSLVNPQLDELRSLLFQPIIYTKVEQLLVFSGLSTNYLLPIFIVLLVIISGLSGKITFDAGMEFIQIGSYSGNIIIPLVSSIFSLFSLLILGQGIALAPKPPEQPPIDAIGEE